MEQKHGTGRMQDYWDKQARQQRSLGADPFSMTEHERRELALKMLLGLHEETVSLQKLAGRYKRHILKDRPVVPSNVADKGADVFKYTLALMQLLGVSHDEFEKAFERKTLTTYDKARSERCCLTNETKLICFDLDDVICDLTPWTQRLKELTGGIPPNAKSLTLIEEYKDEFHNSGKFRQLSPIKGARNGLLRIREAGYTIAIVTARPRWQYQRLHADTVEWLHQHRIPYDKLVFRRDKAEAVCEDLKPAWPEAFVEDHPKNAVALAAEGVPVILFNRPHNDSLTDSHYKYRANDWNEVVDAILHWPSREQDAVDDEASQTDFAASLERG